MNPGSAVSGLYFGHSEAKYLQVGPMAKDQFEDDAQRKGFDLEKTEKFLCSARGY